MLLVQTTVKRSPIHGLGLFADQNISKGTKIWEMSPLLDLEIEPKKFEHLSRYEKDFILFYGYKSKKTNNYHLSFDNVRFINHSMNGNVTIDMSLESVEYPLVAKTNIRKGEEMTQNYFEFDEDHLF